MHQGKRKYKAKLYGKGLYQYKKSNQTKFDKNIAFRSWSVGTRKSDEMIGFPPSRE
ncbi:MAG: hypothetical protein J0M18_08555 [Ignavibacteria bacterium]|nr:hypothetical protein [Ignavibacteria bacterium]